MQQHSLKSFYNQLSKIDEHKIQFESFKDDLFQLEINSILEAQFDLNDRMFFVKCIFNIKRSLTEARKSNSNSALQYINEVDVVKNEIRNNNSLVSLINTFYNNALAYLEYKKGDLGKSLTHLKLSLDIDSKIRKIKGFEILELHQVQILINVIRINSKRNNFNQVFSDCSDLIKYLCGFQSTLLSHKLSENLIENKLTNILLNQVLAELTYNINKYEIEEKRILPKQIKNEIKNVIDMTDYFSINDELVNDQNPQRLLNILNDESFQYPAIKQSLLLKYLHVITSDFIPESNLKSSGTLQNILQLSHRMFGNTQFKWLMQKLSVTIDDDGIPPSS